MRAFAVVVSQVLGNSLAAACRSAASPGQTFLLDGPVEPFQVAVVGRRPYPGMPVGDPFKDAAFGKILGELGTMVRLQSSYAERERSPGLEQSPDAFVRVGMRRNGSVSESGENVQSGVQIHPAFETLDRVHLHEYSGLFRQGPWRIRVPLFPFGIPCALIAFQHSFH